MAKARVGETEGAPMPKDLTRSLLLAADSRPRSQPEDRLTEILREVLLTVPTLAARLAEVAFAIERGEAERIFDAGCYEVSTQFALPGGGRPDVRIEADGMPGVLYLENKLRAGWTKLQKDGYPAVSRRSRIITITTGREMPRSLPPKERPKFVSFSWQRLALSADAIGRAWRQNGWRPEALRPDAPAEFRFLAELISYLEREDAGVQIIEPLSGADLEILPRVDESRTRWKEFRKLVRAAAGQRARVEEAKKSRGSELDRLDPLGLRLRLTRAPGWEGADWLLLSELSDPLPPKRSYQELILSPRPRWMDQGVPLIAAGVALDRLPEWSAEAEEWIELCEELRQSGVWVGATERGRVLRIVQSRPLGELLDPGVTLAEQAESAVDWALGALEQLTGGSRG